MRALCGAIITAGALIGLGLIAVGLGIRYQDVPYTTGADAFVRFRQLDTALAVAFVAAVLTLLVGLGTAFVGLAYHHERRHREYQLHTSGRASTSVEP
jgi:hypothetical protein